MKVKLIIANTMVDTVFFNYGDDYNDINRVFIEDHSDYEEVDAQELLDLKGFVENYNNYNRKKGAKSFAFIVKAPEEISAKSAIKEIREKKERAAKEWAAKKAKEQADKEEKARKAKEEKEFKTIEQKRRQLEKLKKELGE